MASKKTIYQINGKKKVVDSSRDYHSKDGYLTKKQMKKEGLKETNKGKKMVVIKPNFIDYFDNLKRGAQIMLKKDIGQIIAETGIGKKSVVVDAGSGSGALAIFLANIVKKVTTYDIKEKHTELVKKNIKKIGLKNIKAKNGDIYNPKEIKEKNVDLLTLDVPEPENAIKTAEKILKNGGFVVGYSPSITQSKNFVEKLVENKNFIYLKTIETIKREWELKGRRARPEFQMLGHTGFLVFAVKIKK